MTTNPDDRTVQSIAHPASNGCTTKKSPKLLTVLFPSFGDILWVSTLFTILYNGQAMMNADGDLALHLNLGYYILDHGRIPLQDLFSHTMPGKPVMQHEWLTTIIFAGVERAFGLGGIVLLSALLISTAFYLVYRHIRASGSALIVAVPVVLLATTSSRIHWLTRPHLITFLLLAIWVILLNQLAQGKHRRWWLLSIIMLIWTNLHGAFIVGFITWVVYGVGVGWDAVFNRFPEQPLPAKFWRAYLLGGVTSFLASLVNPMGFRLWTDVIGHVGNRFLAERTQEFQPPNFHRIFTWPFLFFIILLVVVLAFSKKKYRSALVFNSAAWLALGLYGARNVPLFAIIAAPFLAQGLDDLFVNAKTKNKLINYLRSMNERIEVVDRDLKGFIWPAISLVLAIGLLSVGFTFNPEVAVYQFDPAVFPVEAVDWLIANPQEGNMFNTYVWGGYLQYRLWPQERVFVDSKADFYGEDFIREYLQVMVLDVGWESLLENYDVTWAILPPESLIARMIESELGWGVIYQDETAVVVRHQ